MKTVKYSWITLGMLSINLFETDQMQTGSTLLDEPGFHLKIV